MAPSTSIPRRSTARLLLPLALLLAALFTYRDAAGSFFFMDDFAMLLRSVERSFGEIVVEDLLGPFPGDRTWPFWRPGWYLLFDLVHMVAGMEPFWFVLVGVLLHTTVAWSAALFVARRTSVLFGLAAGLLIVTSPVVVEAVLWPSASFNVLPAALLIVIGAQQLLLYAETTRVRHLVQALLACLLSLLFKEAAYSMPGIALAAMLCAAPSTRRARCARGLLVALPFACLVGMHFVFRNQVPAGSVGIRETVELTLSHLAEILRQFTTLPAPPWILVSAAGAAFAGLLAIRSPAARFALCWTVAGLFPYVLRTSASRFQEFVLVPLAVAVTLVLHQVAQRGIVRHVVLLALLATVVWQGQRVGPALAPYLAQGELCRAFIARAKAEDLGAEGRIVTEVLPAALHNGIGALFELHLQRSVEVVDLFLVRRPPFAIYANLAFEDLAEDTEVLRFTGGPEVYQRMGKAQLVAGLMPVPLVGLRQRYQVATDPGQALALMVAALPEQVVVLQQEPVPAPATEGVSRLVSVRMGADSRIDVVVDGPGALLVVSHLVDLRTLGGQATVDGVPVPLLTANGLFNAVAVPAGLRRVSIFWRQPSRPAAGG